MAGLSTRRGIHRFLLVGSVCTILVSRAAGEAAPRPHFTIISAEYRDLDGDRDIYPDTGETGRVAVTLRNDARALTGATFVLVSSDPGVDCITERRVSLGSLAPGQTVMVGSLDPLQPGFTFRASDALNSASGADPARIELCLRLAANEIQGLSDPVCFTLMADLDAPPGATQTFIPGPDGITPSSDDGTLLETFDVDRDGDGLFTVNDTFRMIDGGTGLTTHGIYMRGSNDTSQLGVIAGVACGGFSVPADGNPGCILNPAYPMDWHLHCPPNSLRCPNVETGSCLGGCSYATPSDGQKAFSAPNSLHMGAHFDLGSSLIGDTTHLRSLQAFVSSPINLAVYPRPGDLVLSMWQIVDLMDNTALGPGNDFQCFDCGDVQVQLDRDPNPAVDDWGPWEKLAPFQNVYDHMSSAWSALMPVGYYCLFTPADAGGAAPATRGDHETMCFPQGAWSRCGSARGTTSQAVSGCAGPGVVDPSGAGVWVETKFNLADHLGQRIRIRWIGSTWMFDSVTDSYFAVGNGWPPTLEDDGWWLDDITITGVVTSQVSPSPDDDPPPATSCPALCADVDGDGYGSPGSTICPAGFLADCNDLDAAVHPGATEACDGIDDDCDGVIPAVEADADGDGWRVCGGDCNDVDPTTFPGASEVNDGRDNECPGDPGFGIIDEISGVTGFLGGGPKLYCWPPQSGATSYLLARSGRPDFTSDCVATPVTDLCLDESGSPPPGRAFFYLVRAQSPHVGSWGQDSSGMERTGICGL